MNRMGRKNPLPSSTAVLIIVAIVMLGGMGASMLINPEIWGATPEEKGPAND